MKKTAIALLVFILMALTACGVPSTPAATQQSTSTGGVDSSTLTLDERLAIGTLQLENTELAVDSETASALLPLWRAVRALKTSDTISAQEMDALYQQIEDAMTFEQVKAIEVMTFTNDDIDTLMASLGVQYDTNSSQNTASASSETSLPAMPPGGGVPGSDSGMPPAGDMGGVIMAADNIDAQASTSMQINAGSGSINVFIDPLIRLLKEREIS
jgi:hypothetical protein